MAIFKIINKFKLDQYTELAVAVCSIILAFLLSSNSLGISPNIFIIIGFYSIALILFLRSLFKFMANLYQKHQAERLRYNHLYQLTDREKAIFLAYFNNQSRCERFANCGELYHLRKCGALYKVPSLGGLEETLNGVAYYNIDANTCEYLSSHPKLLSITKHQS